MLEQEFKFDKETLKIQRAARNEMRRKMKVLFFMFVAGVILILGLNRIYPSAGGFTIFLFLPLLFGSNWIQWNTLITHKIQCPHCGQLLAKRANLLFSPSPKCRHCGKIALASIAQLVRDAQSEKVQN